MSTPRLPELNRGLLQAAKQALAALDRHAFLPWGQPDYPAPTPGANLLYEAQSYLRAAIKREEELLDAIRSLPDPSATPQDQGGER